METAVVAGQVMMLRRAALLGVVALLQLITSYADDAAVEGQTPVYTGHLEVKYCMS